MFRTLASRAGVAMALLGCCAPLAAAEIEDNAGEHSHHHHVTESTKYRLVDYTLPNVALVRADGKNVQLPDELNDGRPVVMNFIYTTCTTICPVSSRIFSELQEKLGGQREHVHMVSISIDPEEDTPQVLAKYADKFGAGHQWQFYTGTIEASVAVQRAFDVYTGDKMDHNPATFIRSAPGKLWLRIDGFAKADELLQVLQNTHTSKQVRLVDDVR